MIPPCKKKDKVAVVATAKRLEKAIDTGVQTLKSWGLSVDIGEKVNEQHGYFAGDDEQRRSDFQKALDDPEIKAIIFARGGYGTTRILDQVNFDAFKDQPKWLVGFSDLTSILLQVSTLNHPSIHGPMCVTLAQDKVSDQCLYDLLFGETKFEFPLQSDLCIEGVSKGKIVGGNLSLIYESIDTGNEIQTKGNILFLEEVGEAKYSVDRMLNKLKRCGKLKGLSGAIIGSFSNITDSQNYFVESIEEIIMTYLRPLNIPVAFGLEAGHEKRNYALMMGCNAEVTVRPNKLTIEYFHVNI